MTNGFESLGNDNDLNDEKKLPSIDNNEIQPPSHLENTMFYSDVITTVKDLVRSHGDKELEQLVRRGMKRVQGEVRQVRDILSQQSMHPSVVTMLNQSYHQTQRDIRLVHKASWERKR